MRKHLGDAYAAYGKAGPLVRAQVAPFMDPLLMLLGELVAAAADGQKQGKCGGCACKAGQATGFPHIEAG